MYSELKDKVAVVTGAGSNLGREIALTFARAGAKIVAADIDGVIAGETCRLAQSSEAMSFAVDMANGSQVRQMVDEIRAAKGGIDIFVNCAGITQYGRPSLADVEEEQFDRIIRINLKGVWLGMKNAIPPMVERGAGCIVNVASIDGLVGEAGMSIYAASKHGILGLTKSAALEYGPKGVRINAVCPSRLEGAMINPIRKEPSPEEKLAGDRYKNPASGRAGRHDELAATVIFLCSTGAGSIHGAAIPVDGGFTAS